MSSKQEQQTILIPMNLGSPSQYDAFIFPLMKMKRSGSRDQVDIVLETTLDELFKIRDMAGDSEELKSVFVNAKNSYDKLSWEKSMLQDQLEKTTFNPVKLVARYRSL